MPDFWDSIPDATPDGKQSIPTTTGSDFWDSIPAAEEEPDYNLQGLGVSKEELGPKPTGEEMLQDLKGKAKGTASLASGAVSWIPAGLTGAAVLPMKAVEGAVTGDMMEKLLEGAKTVQEVQDFWSYIPDDPEARDVVNVGAAPFEGLAKLGRKAGEAIMDKTGSPALATAAGTAIEGLPFLAGGAVVGARRGIRGIREGVESVKGMEGVTEPMPMEAGKPALSEKAKIAIADEATATALNREYVDNLAGRVDESEAANMVRQGRYDDFKASMHDLIDRGNPEPPESRTYPWEPREWETLLRISDMEKRLGETAGDTSAMEAALARRKEELLRKKYDDFVAAQREVLDKSYPKNAVPEPTTPEVLKDYPDIANKTKAEPEEVIRQKAGVASLNPKQQKAYLIDEVDKAITEAPEAEAYYDSVRQKYESDTEYLWRMDELGRTEYPKRKAEHGTITIEVPGDGKFTVLNTRDALTRFRDNVRKNFPVTEGVSKPRKPPMPSTKTTGARITFEGGEGEYYNEFKPRKQAVYATEKDKEGNIRAFYTKDGFFTDGYYAIKMPDPKKVGGATVESIDVKLLDRVPSDGTPATIVGEAFAENTVQAHVVDAGGVEGHFNPKNIDAILTLYPKAKPILTDTGLVFKEGKRVVGVTNKIRTEKPLSVQFPERFAEVAAKKGIKSSDAEVAAPKREIGVKQEPEEVILSFLGTGETGKMGHIAAPVAIGAAAGIESDEEGKLTYNPTKGLIGAVGLTAAPLAMKPVKAVGRAIGKTGPGKAWREFWKPLSTVPEYEKYMTERYKSFGDVDRAERLADAVHKRLKKLPDDQKEAVFRFLDGELNESNLPESVVPYAKTLQTVNTVIGRMLVKRGLLDEKAFAANKGQYIRYLYLRHVLGDKLTGLGQGGAKMDLSYLKKRKDLTPEERRAIGWIEDVSVAEPVSIARPLSDIAKYDFMSKVASNENWTWKPSIVEVEGQKMTVGKLAEELANQQAVAKKLPNVEEVTERLKTLRDAMDKATEATKNVPADFVQLNGRNYGPLDGAFVKKPIARDLSPIMDFSTSNQEWYSKLANQLFNIERKGMAAFKVGKVAFNLPTVVRNIGSNIIQLNMSGIPLAEIPVHYAKALHSMLKQDVMYREAVRRGIFKTNWSATEINEVLKEVRQWEGKSWYSITPRLRNLAKYYGKIDDLAKMAKFREQIGRGVSPDKAAIEAQKWGMDYSLAHPVVKTSRRHVAPFITYQTKILPLIAETLAERPWIIAKYAMIPSILTAVVRDKFNYNDEQWRKLRKLLPRFIHNSESYMPLPNKTPEGNLEWVDAQYFLPWGTAMESLDSAVEGRPREAIQGIGIGNPFFQIAKVLTDTARNDPPTDPFTKKEIYSRLDTPKEQVLKTLEWVYNQWAPSMMTRWGAAGYTATVGDKDKYGRTITPEQAAGRWVGVNIAAPSKKQAEISKRVDAKALRSTLYRKMMDPTISKERKAEYRKEYNRQMKELRQQ